MDYKKINEQLKDLSGLRNRLSPVHKEIVNEITEDYGNQGDSNEIYEVYDINLPDGLYIRLRIGSDSYGESEFVEGITFVKGKKKEIITYEF